jgi:hypothetical protein
MEANMKMTNRMMEMMAEQQAMAAQNVTNGVS